MRWLVKPNDPEARDLELAAYRTLFGQPAPFTCSPQSPLGPLTVDACKSPCAPVLCPSEFFQYNNTLQDHQTPHQPRSLRNHQLLSRSIVPQAILNFTARTYRDVEKRSFEARACVSSTYKSVIGKFGKLPLFRSTFLQRLFISMVVSGTSISLALVCAPLLNDL